MRRKSLRQKLIKKLRSAFVGREYELDLFKRNLRLNSEELEYKDIVFVSGIGGIGKTTLLQKFIQISKQKGNVCIYLDEDLKSVKDFMFKTVIQLEEQQEVQNTFEFKKVFNELERKTETRVKGENNSDQIISHSDREGTNFRTSNFANDFIPIKDRENEFFHTLTEKFIEILYSIDEKIKICFFIDTFEVTKFKIGVWLREFLQGEHGDIPINLLITIASRNSLKDDGLDVFKMVTQEIQLSTFSEEDALELLKIKGISDLNRIDDYLKISKGIPVLLAMLADSSPDYIEKSVFNEIKTKVKNNQLDPAIDSLFRLMDSKNLENEKNELEYIISKMKYLRNEIVHNRIELNYADKENARIINSILSFVERIEKYQF